MPTIVLRQLFAMELIDVPRGKDWTYVQVSTNKELLIAVETEVKRLDGDLFAIISGQGRIKILNVDIVRALFGARRRKVLNT